MIDESEDSYAGDDNTVIGQPPWRMGSRNTIINLADVQGSTILNRGGLAVGAGARADSTSTAIGAGAGAGVPAQLVTELETLRNVLCRDGADVTDANALVMAVREEDRSKIASLWAAVKVAAATNDAIGLAARITPLIAPYIHI